MPINKKINGKGPFPDVLGTCASNHILQTSGNSVGDVVSVTPTVFTSPVHFFSCTLFRHDRHRNPGQPYLSQFLSYAKLKPRPCHVRGREADHYPHIDVSWCLNGPSCFQTINIYFFIVIVIKNSYHCIPENL